MGERERRAVMVKSWYHDGMGHSTLYGMDGKKYPLFPPTVPGINTVACNQYFYPLDLLREDFPLNNIVVLEKIAVTWRLVEDASESASANFQTSEASVEQL